MSCGFHPNSRALATVGLSSSPIPSATCEDSLFWQGWGACQQNHSDMWLSCLRLRGQVLGLSRHPMQREDKHSDRKQMSVASSGLPCLAPLKAWIAAQPSRSLLSTPPLLSALHLHSVGHQRGCSDPDSEEIRILFPLLSVVSKLPYWSGETARTY